MAIIASRIDGRLVHGQVANLWTTKLQASRIIVVDDEASKDKIQKSGLRMAAPMSVRLSVLDADTAADHINAGKYDSQRVFVVAKRPATFLKLVQKGVPIKELNVGNMSQTNETKSVSKSINVVQEDIDAFHELDKAGVKLTAQMVPADDSHDFLPMLAKVEG
ncbi:MAG: PTS sugar transporter subunit IIB [Lactobacillus sp.]|jgi:PTS system mannose-specific IIB component|uniref:PTS system mannose/fructose/N-acetylgalactosamine-transporter subunit IIB n=1 Tax=Lacticaseibacillus suilingensis TaxID=2799577 RepID=A0ABW4BCZ1_9LACO|nr:MULTISPECIES: PTS sugar transporter subunit IIB [Lacticaseibacillus]MCI1894931.1 PTS sugar transporter subunit IIB [Lactobacillus sp.]MCI1917193.1 PTS sugar transporter subunit IIB [Lactobacillus sp.]MCI1942196.1 PTS sugar transporter subunit IIB [Lactobacillus sp.]MCI1972638.1 PTS sugar transporter subunit IIB [Lactobacillus sp.]MCI2017419.1 PTS sugar transporter subunit IIB [Lactobacillus sp.]